MTSHPLAACAELWWGTTRGTASAGRQLCLMCGRRIGFKWFHNRTLFYHEVKTPNNVTGGDWYFFHAKMITKTANLVGVNVPTNKSAWYLEVYLYVDKCHGETNRFSMKGRSLVLFIVTHFLNKPLMPKTYQSPNFRKYKPFDDDLIIFIQTQSNVLHDKTQRSKWHSGNHISVVALRPYKFPYRFPCDNLKLTLQNI